MAALPTGLLPLAVALAALQLGPATVRGALARPAILNLAPRAAGQTIGTCTFEEAEALFKDYSESCNAMITNLIDQFTKGDGANIDANIVGELYAIICSDECRKPIEEFRDRCDDTGKLTQPILAACDQDLGGQCIARLSNNLDDVTEVVRTCSRAVATETCTQDCRDSLERLKVNLGCACIDSLFSTSTYGYDTLAVADSRLWSLCGVSFLSDCDTSADPADPDSEDLVSHSVVSASGSILITVTMLCAAALNWL